MVMSTYNEADHPRGGNPNNTGQWTTRTYGEAPDLQLGTSPTREQMLAEFIAPDQMVTDEDREWGREQARDQAVWNRAVDTFERHMPGKRRSKANLAEWERYVDENLDPEEVEKSAKFHARYEFFGRAYEQGLPIPEDFEDEFESIWRGESVGRSEDDFKRDLVHYDDLRRQLDAGAITPRAVAGRGATRKSAAQWIENSRAESERALATRGRSVMVNVSNVEYRMRERGDLAPRY
jgi:hypothetical protein